MIEHMPQPRQESPEQVTAPDLRERLMAVEGSMPESLERPVRWAQEEITALAAAVPEKSGDDAQQFVRRRSWVRAHVVATGIALATMAGIATPKAEAGEKGDGWRRAGGIISVVAGVGERVMAHKQDEHLRRGGAMEYQIRMLEIEAEGLLRRYERLAKELNDIQDRRDFEKREDRQERLSWQLSGVSRHMDDVRQRVLEIQAQIKALGPQAEKELRAGAKSGMWADIANIARGTGDRMRYGY